MTNEAIEAAALLPCPFCGGDATPDYSNIEGEAAYHFHCQNGDCPAWPNVQGYTEAEAIAAWNTRAAAPALMAEGARLERERIVDWLKSCPHPVAITIRAAIEAGEHLPATIVKEHRSADDAGHLPRAD
ncbi:Lar family restriction alleviation protein [Novosphingobium sp. NPDC080210]|uniref:Lar family restriction alleviation protein n=1 Tax=Novosphingobium sp. NPDC080210 TaxID=3390596 RepID=UPI003CFF1841